MMVNYFDVGGLVFLSMKINEVKATLLRGRARGGGDGI